MKEANSIQVTQKQYPNVDICKRCGCLKHVHNSKEYSKCIRTFNKTKTKTKTKTILIGYVDGFKLTKVKL